LTPSKAFQREAQTLDAMIALYCRGRHSMPEGELCYSCRELLTYALSRLDKCPFGDNKPACSACPVHCYKPARRKDIQEVMRYSGPRMMRSHPLLAIRHLLKKLKTSKVETP